MDWQTIMNNPKFVDQYGMYVTGDPNQWWNNLPEEQKDISMISLEMVRLTLLTSNNSGLAANQ